MRRTYDKPVLDVRTTLGRLLLRYYDSASACIVALASRIRV